MYRSDYKTASTGDFYDIRCAVPPHQANESDCKNWPLWPDPSLNYASDPNLWSDPRSIDDFWHRGGQRPGPVFSAANPTSVIAGLAGALAGINSKTASGAGPGRVDAEPDTHRSLGLPGLLPQPSTGTVTSRPTSPTRAPVWSTPPPPLWSVSAKARHHDEPNLCDNRNIYLIRTDGPSRTTGELHGSAPARATRPGPRQQRCPTTWSTTEQANFGALKHLAAQPVPEHDRRHARQQRTSRGEAPGATWSTSSAASTGTRPSRRTSTRSSTDPCQRARRRRRRPAGLRQGAVRDVQRHRLRRLPDGERVEDADDLRRRQRRHAARVLCGHRHG